MCTKTTWNLATEQSHSASRFFFFFLPLIGRRRRRCLNSLLLSSRNFATMVTWRHTSPLYKHWYRLITVEPRLRSLKRGLVISRFFSIHYTVTGAENIVRYTEDFVISRFHYKPQVETRGSLVRKRKTNRPHPSPQVLTIASIRSFPSLWISLNPHPLSSGETKWFSINSVYDSSISLCLRTELNVKTVKASATLVYVHISKNLYVIFIFHHLLTYWFCKPSYIVPTWIARN